MTDIQTKFPLIRKEQTTTTEWTLEGKETRKSTYRRTVRPSRQLDTKEEIDDYITQMGEARMRYGLNLMDLPYCTEYAVGVNHPLHGYAVAKQDALPSKLKATTKALVDAEQIIQGELDAE